jgi:hypothetical protein
MLSYRNIAAKRAALLMVVGVLSMAVYVWAAPPGDYAAGQPARACPGERFRQADSDGDGALSKDEALRGMPRIAKNFQAIDADNSGRVSCDELRAFIQARRKALCEASK